MTAGDVVWVPFPHVEDNRLRPRPALLVATGMGDPHDLCWALMITSAANEAWPGDVLIPDHDAVGLPVASRIRTAKIATVTAASTRRLGRLPDPLWAEVRARVLAQLALAP